MFAGFDAYYHMRRVLYCLIHFPSVLNIDPYINFPHGAKPIWSPLFDITAALFAMPLFDPANPESAERMVVWFPPLLGALSIVVFFLLVNRYFGFMVACLSGAILSVLPGHYWYSQIGFLDHHVAITLMSIVLLGAGMGLMDRLSDHSSHHRKLWPGVVLYGLTGPIALLVWPGCLLEVTLFGIGFAGFVVARHDHREAARCAGALALANLLGVVLTLPAADVWPQWGAFSPVVMSKFQPWLFGIQVFQWTVCFFLWRGRWAGRSRLSRIAQATMVAGLLLAGSFGLLGELRVGMWDAVRWFGRLEGFQHNVVESRPLFSAGGGWSTEIAERHLSYLIYVFPLVWFVIAYRWWKRSEESSIGLCLLWAAGLALASCFQFRFVSSCAAAVALLGAWGFESVYRWLLGRIGVARRNRVFVRAVLGLLILVSLSPIAESYRLPLRNLGEWMRGAPISRTMLDVNMVAQVRTARWLRDQTPQTSGLWDANGHPEYGILAKWYNGHIIEYVAQRPTVTDNFGDDIGTENFRLAKRYFVADESEASTIIEDLRVRYVVAERPTERVPDNSMWKLFWSSEAALRRHRLVYEFSLHRQGTSAELPLFRVFEFVKGARVVGDAPPGAEIVVRLSGEADRSDEVLYVARTTANHDGKYELILPYSTTDEGPSIERDWMVTEKAGAGAIRLTNDAIQPSSEARALRSGGSYLIQSGQGRSRLEVTESQVQDGATLMGPQFR